MSLVNNLLNKLKPPSIWRYMYDFAHLHECLLTSCFDSYIGNIKNNSKVNSSVFCRNITNKNRWFKNAMHDLIHSAGSTRSRVEVTFVSNIAQVKQHLLLNDRFHLILLDACFSIGGPCFLLVIPLYTIIFHFVFSRLLCVPCSSAKPIQMKSIIIGNTPSQFPLF